MNYSWIDFLTLVGSVGLFLYGMKLMSEGLQKIAGDRLRTILAAMTSNRFTGMLTGVIVTALVQSSSATTVMIVSFVNAGLISLAQSMAVIMGANVGTTVTTWIIAIFGFKFNIAMFVLPLIAVALPFFNSGNGKRNSWGEFIIGFALLFLGLDCLNHSVPDLKANPELFEILTGYTTMGYGSVLIFLVVGMILTMVVQASSASFTIALIMCSKGWIPFDMACALVLGSNIGTCITPVIASISANTMAKRAAAGHLLFNVLGTVWTVILYIPFCHLVVWICESLGQGNPNELLSFVTNLESSQPEIAARLSNQTLDMNNQSQAAIATQFESLKGSVSFGMTMFHTVFNMINLFVMIWLTGLYVKIVSKLIPDSNSQDDAFKLKYISNGLIASGDLCLVQVRKETSRYAEEAYKMFGMVRSMIDQPLGSEKQIELCMKVKELEQESDRAEIEIATYINQINAKSLSADGELMSRRLLKVVDELESIADSTYHMAVTLRNKSEQRIYFSDEFNTNVTKMIALTDAALVHMLKVIEREENSIPTSALNKAYNYEDEINNFRSQLRNAMLDQIDQQQIMFQQTTFYMDLISECEKIGDYVINVLTALCER